MFSFRPTAGLQIPGRTYPEGGGPPSLLYGLAGAGGVAAPLIRFRFRPTNASARRQLYSGVYRRGGTICSFFFFAVKRGFFIWEAYAKAARLARRPAPFG